MQFRKLWNVFYRLDLKSRSWKNQIKIVKSYNGSLYSRQVDGHEAAKLARPPGLGFLQNLFLGTRQLNISQFTGKVSKCFVLSGFALLG